MLKLYSLGVLVETPNSHLCKNTVLNELEGNQKYETSLKLSRQQNLNSAQQISPITKVQNHRRGIQQFKNLAKCPVCGLNHNILKCMKGDSEARLNADVTKRVERFLA